MEDAGFNARVRRIESLVHDVESLRDPAAGAVTLELVRAIMDVHAAGLTRIAEITGQAGEAIQAAMVKDDLVSSLLLLHGLHPDPLDQRVAQALAKLEPYLRRRSATAHLVSIEEGVVRVKVEGGPPGLGAALREAVEEAVYSLAPEAVEVFVECASEAVAGFVPLSSLVAG
jgi:hypothetical protein